MRVFIDQCQPANDLLKPAPNPLSAAAAAAAVAAFTPPTRRALQSISQAMPAAALAILLPCPASPPCACARACFAPSSSSSSSALPAPLLASSASISALSASISASSLRARVTGSAMAGRQRVEIQIGERAPSVALMPVVRPEGMMLDWRASIRALRRALYSVLLLGRLLQLPRPGGVGNRVQDSSVDTEKVARSGWTLDLSRFLFWVHKEDDALVRRALARKRNKLCEWDDSGTAWQDHLFVNSRGQTIFTQSWKPIQGDHVKGLVVLLHGLNEHSGRYARFAKQLNLQGYTVFGMDWIGHGGSDGLHGYVESLDHAVSDTEEFLLKISADYPGTPIFLFGHSTGGAIVLKAALQAKLGKLLTGLILTSPAIRVQPTHPVVAVLAPLFSVLLPRYQFRGANRRGLPVTHDPAEHVAKYADPLVYTGPIRIRTGTEILRITSYLQRKIESVSTPFFVLHGTEDKITDPKASQSLYNLACSKQKKLKLYEGLLHDLLFELERDVVTMDIIKWLDTIVAEL